MDNLPRIEAPTETPTGKVAFLGFGDICPFKMHFIVSTVALLQAVHKHVINDDAIETFNS